MSAHTHYYHEPIYVIDSGLIIIHNDESYFNNNFILRNKNKSAYSRNVDWYSKDINEADAFH